MISATQAYNCVQCPHRVAQDVHADPALRDEASEFVELLWNHGVVHEASTIEKLGITADFTNQPPVQRRAWQ